MIEDLIPRLISMLEQAIQEWEWASSTVCNDRCIHSGGLELCDPDLAKMRAELETIKQVIQK